MGVLLKSLVFAILTGNLALAQAPSAPLGIKTAALPAPVAGAHYDVQLQATGGQPPYKWSVTAGALPAGIHIDPPSGLLVGTPAQPGPFGFTVRVADSSTPPQTAERAFLSEAVPSVEVRWVRPPRVENGGIFSSVQVANHLPKEIRLTLIIEGVNDIGKAFVLGYQHTLLAGKKLTPEIPFGTTLPRGAYMVYVNAVGVKPQSETLFRALRQNPSILQVP